MKELKELNDTLGLLLIELRTLNFTMQTIHDVILLKGDNEPDSKE